MDIKYKVVPEDNIGCIRDLCNGLMAYQKSVAHIHPEFFDNMCFETRMIPAIKSAKANYIVVANVPVPLFGKKAALREPPAGLNRPMVKRLNGRDMLSKG